MTLRSAARELDSEVETPDAFLGISDQSCHARDVSGRGHLRGAGGRWLLAGCAGLAGFFLLEAWAREDGKAASLDPSSDDQGTTKEIVAAFALALGLTPIVRLVPVARLPRAAAPFGLTLEAVGLAVRAWSMRTLGRAYSRTLRTEDEQLVIESGPYRFVRHPGYLGSLLTWTGFALTSSSLPVVSLVGALLLRAYRRRISAEEELLRREFPSYAEYSHRTKRLIPFVW